MTVQKKILKSIFDAAIRTVDPGQAVHRHCNRISNLYRTGGFKRKGITLLSAGTDGGDGPADAAGAFADGMTVLRGEKKGADHRHYLAYNDSYEFFRNEGGLFLTGPIGTNVNDLQLIIIE